MAVVRFLLGPKRGCSVADHVYFEDFEVDLDNGEIRRQGVRVRLRGKPCQILVTLLKQPGEIVPRQQLIESLWPVNTFVDFDSNLKTALSNLRRVLGDSADYPRFVETVQGVGYRFLQPVSKIKPAPAAIAARERQSAASLLPISNLAGTSSPHFLRVPGGSLEESDWRHIIAATVILMVTAIVIFAAMREQTSPLNHDKYGRVMLVLPFENLTGDESTETLSDGITKQMTDSLQQKLTGKVAVVARDSALTYKHTRKSFDSISKELGGVDYVLEGSVRRSKDNNIDIDAELFRVSDHKSIWTGTFEHKLADIQSFQQDIATHILESISVEIIQAQWPDLRTGGLLDERSLYSGIEMRLRK
jgi:TolB-like protein/DNA-binding winged helix-turn-helix (wHTH) protein